MRLPDPIRESIKRSTARWSATYNWHRWFAWWPTPMKGWVECGTGEWDKVVPDHRCWLETIERRRCSLGSGGTYWEYRYPPNEIRERRR